MNYPLRSANNAYYASKEPLLIRGTKEGRKNPPASFSYVQKQNDVSASTNKIYATPGTTPGTIQPQAQKAGAVRPLKYRPKIMQDVVQAFQQGAGGVRIEGTAVEINQARVAVDMAVGRKSLTRKQADLVSFVVVIPKPTELAVPVTPPQAVQLTQEPVAVAVTSDHRRSLSDRVIDEVKQQADQDALSAIRSGLPDESNVVPDESNVVPDESNVVPDESNVVPDGSNVVPDESNVVPDESNAEVNQSGTPEADEILNPPVATKSVKKRKSRQKKKDETITEADIASAFGIADDSDD